MAMHAIILYGNAPSADLFIEQAIVAGGLILLATALGRRIRKALRDAL
jgi:hypothetical protein